MKKFIVFLLLIFAARTQAQTTDSAKVYAFSSLGLSFVDNNYDPASGSSIQTASGLELRLSRFSGVGITASFDSYGYKKSGIGYNLDGSLKATAVGAFYRYRFGQHGLQPYLKAGGGTAWLFVPVVSISQGITNIQKKSQNVGMALAEAGVQARVFAGYSVLIAAEKKWMGKSSLVDDTSLGTITFKVGFISSF